MTSKFLSVTFLLLVSVYAKAQEPINITVFNKQPINFQGKKGTDDEVIRLMNGRLVYKSNRSYV